MSNTKVTSAPKLKSLPPTSDAFTQHVYRAHYETMIGKAALSSGPPVSANSVRYGWTANDGNLLPVMLPDDVSPVPFEVLQMIKCGCSLSQPYFTGNYSCVVAQMSCSMFCNRHATNSCNNQHARNTTSSSDESAVEDV